MQWVLTTSHLIMSIDYGVRARTIRMHMAPSGQTTVSYRHFRRAYFGVIVPIALRCIVDLTAGELDASTEMEYQH